MLPKRAKEWDTTTTNNNNQIHKQHQSNSFTSCSQTTNGPFVVSLSPLLLSNVYTFFAHTAAGRVDSHFQRESKGRKQGIKILTILSFGIETYDRTRPQETATYHWYCYGYRYALQFAMRRTMHKDLRASHEEFYVYEC